MSSKVLVKLALREHIAAYILASISDILLLLVLSQLASKAGQQVDLIRPVALHQVLIGILVLAVIASGIVRRGWRWQYVVSSTLFSGYVGYRMAARFVSALRLVGPLQTMGVPSSDYLGTYYVLTLSAAVSYVLMILVLRRAYGRLSSARTTGPSLGVAGSYRGALTRSSRKSLLSP